MKGFLVNRTGKHKHIFKSLLKPNERLNIASLYLSIYAKKMTESQFLFHLKSTIERMNGIQVEELDETPFELPAEMAQEREAEEKKQEVLEKATQMTPSEVASLEYTPGLTQEVLSKIDSSRTLSYALTLLRKKNKNKRLQRALEKRIAELQ